MRVGPLKLFTRTRDTNGRPVGLMIAALHWRNSITWRWVLSRHERNTLIPNGFGASRTYKQQPGWNGRISLNLPLLGYWQLTIQPNKFQPGWQAYI